MQASPSLLLVVVHSGEDVDDEVGEEDELILILMRTLRKTKRIIIRIVMRLQSFNHP